MMVMCVAGIRAGTNTLGDFVLINAMMIQLYQPLNFMGMLYREVKQAIIDIEVMFEIMNSIPKSRTGRTRRLSSSQRAGSSSKTCISPMTPYAPF